MASEIFNIFDFSNKGFIDWESFNELINIHFPHMKSDIRRTIFLEVDSNGDGRVTFRDLERLLNFN